MGLKDLNNFGLAEKRVATSGKTGVVLHHRAAVAVRHSRQAQRRHSGARLLARTRNPFVLISRCTMDSGLALRAPRNDRRPQPFGGDSGCTISWKGASASQRSPCAASAG
ncbi:hypothetical protein DCG74_11315 [Bradyrhizobium sp. WBAH42]|nr:hypothetical protein [Bradyrhizobium sp. WBAH30]MDD1541775.1 hypothetical protein [Bradyrhizobium sp. WBAH41]MDD1555359.1 hypothetical protein [Bradyrhizobium sp. WBAH23]MDD1564190.1 hypothetical protein [Bradyrhizobium sp. WBAH33]MDD1587784.1 hypothetical protein [Bradyrhizobium sp. WBAH42]NRB87244.1 hypothetical protein [Bradyrhizobium sp. WBAH10]QCJ89043.1 hypothetical protein DAA57_11445 [Bradyrhizobium yuanmingense]